MLQFGESGFMSKPTVLIGGGYDKGSEYDQWIEAFDGKVKALVLIGQTREKIAECARAHGVTNVILADTFEEAFDICVKQAQSGDAVLLSPTVQAGGCSLIMRCGAECLKSW